MPLQPGFRYVAKLGGIAATQDYPYVVSALMSKGQRDCHGLL
jgi:hypothetical protein